MEHDLWLCRQPLCSATGEATGYEVLVRSKAEKNTQKLIESYESLGLSVMLDQWVYLRLFEFLKENSDRARYSINISPLSLQDPSLARDLVRAVRQYRINPSWIKIELTERFLIPWTPVNSSSLLYLKGEGFEIWLDDFGAGHSLLDLTDRVRPNGIKIDGSYIKRLAEPRCLRLVKSLIWMAKDFGCEVTAEWVETESDWSTLIDLGVDWGQGWYLGKPEPLPQIKQVCRLDKEPVTREPESS
jgi:EAL domain-containing protein (putative c-di-GMP-specific phosphodiesterase class I)